MANVKSSFLQILHMDAGDTLELRMTSSDYIKQITLNIKLIGLGIFQVKIIKTIRLVSVEVLWNLVFGYLSLHPALESQQKTRGDQA